MKTSSPLRYPGGKSALAHLLLQIRKLNGLSGRSIAEPFAGGAGAALTLLYLEEAESIVINDADSSIYAFWWTLVHRFNPFAEMLAKTRVTMAEWRRQRDIYRTLNRQSMLKRAFATFFLNRCNRSGIIMNGGPIGGISQNGNWRLNARFNKEDLLCRCARVAEYRQRISVSNSDGINLLSKLDGARTFFFIDPPYFDKGRLLYLNSLDRNYHESLSKKLRSMPDAAWILTYDDCPEIRSIYRDWAVVRPFSLNYAAAIRRSGKELLIAPKWMKLPPSQKSIAVAW